MKKTIILIILILNLSITAFADDVSVYFNEEKMDFIQSPIIQNDYTLVPFRAIFEKLDMTVQWFESDRRVTAQGEDVSITLFIDNPEMIVNGEKKELGTPPVIYNDYTMVPLRAVAESVGANVSWDGDSRTVTITAKESEFDLWSKQVLELTNIEREKRGYSPLKWSDALAEIADAHCNDMIERDFFSHDNPDGLTPFDRIKSANISYWIAGENIAAGQSSPEAVVKEWMNSKGHRENILNPDYEYLGVSVRKGGRYGIYWVQEFALFKE